MKKISFLFRSIIGASVLVWVAIFIYRDNSERDQKLIVKVNPREPLMTLDPQNAYDQASGFWIRHLYEGLFTENPQGVIQPALVSEYSWLSPTQLLLKLKEVNWSDGEPLKAQHFVYSFQRCFRVHCYHQGLFHFLALKNTAAIREGIMSPSALGVRALSDHTLMLEFEYPHDRWETLLSLPVFAPCRDEQCSRWEELPRPDLPTIGAYQIQQVFTGSLKLKKNPFYYRVKDLKIDIIDGSLISSDPVSSYRTYQSGALDFIILNGETEQMALSDQHQLKKTRDEGVIILSANQREGRLFQDADLREALFYGLNRLDFVQKVMNRIGNYPFDRLLMPSTLKEHLHQKHLFHIQQTYNPERATQAVQRYLQKKGLSKVPSFEFLYDDKGTDQSLVIYMKQNLEKIFHNEVSLVIQPSNIYYQQLATGHYDLSLRPLTSWMAHPLEFLQIFLSEYFGNFEGVRIPEFDAQYELVLKDQSLQNAQSYKNLERLLLDQFSVIPIYVSQRTYLAERLKQEQVKTPVIVDLRYAYKE